MDKRVHALQGQNNSRFPCLFYPTTVFPPPKRKHPFHPSSIQLWKRKLLSSLHFAALRFLRDGHCPQSSNSFGKCKMDRGKTPKACELLGDCGRAHCLSGQFSLTNLFSLRTFSSSSKSSSSSPRPQRSSNQVMGQRVSYKEWMCSTHNLAFVIPLDRPSMAQGLSFDSVETCANHLP